MRRKKQTKIDPIANMVATMWRGVRNKTGERQQLYYYYKGVYDMLQLAWGSFPHMPPELVEAYLDGMMLECEAMFSQKVVAHPERMKRISKLRKMAKVTVA